MNRTSLHCILKFDINPPYDKTYRSVADALTDFSAVQFDDKKTEPAVDITIFLCDTDDAVRRRRAEGVPVIAVSHAGNVTEDLMGTPWLVLSPEALTPEFLYEVYCRHYERPMWILETERCRLRELSVDDCDALLFLQKENAPHWDGCFFPADCDDPEKFLSDYIRHQYPFFGFGLYAVLEKDSGDFMGIAGFVGVTEATPDGNTSDMVTIVNTGAGHRPASAEVSYAFLQKYQHRGFAKEVLQALLAYGKETGGFGQFPPRLRPENTASAALARTCGVTIYYK